MAGCCNETCLNDWTFQCLPNCAWVVFGILCAMLVLSVSLNIFFCAWKCHSGEGMCRLRTRQKRSSRQMEDNPIYGNINYMQTSEALFTEADPPHTALSSSSLRDQHRVNPNSQSKIQDCYANLTLKAPRVQSSHSSPQIQEIQYSDVMHPEEPIESEKEDDGITDDVSTVSDLYASVQTQRTKTLGMTDGGEGYANHL